MSELKQFSFQVETHGGTKDKKVQSENTLILYFININLFCTSRTPLKQRAYQHPRQEPTECTRTHSLARGENGQSMCKASAEERHKSSTESPVTIDLGTKTTMVLLRWLGR